ncbi:class III poly(R)-hydroxyalkanoic acid synthase subunit PhaE [Luteimonas sp. MC1895]|uniref:class III poly(R)-hydroxyalkanoic acid synthase subunit PhaE n=1 Tax=Luteimonas sp. MC1895 TaxID=2819513 RepID=UPI0018F0BD7B|nr:class III poly(R)-hydroxyalkanoic acid synthase subunit PhaE [Luteimonas sp. MC1895]MBJ6979275.1 class III poly(R)-hydroxyalkanoic acid synthase subunit PhaE [Luteimonas sp. MC1895]
MLGNPQGDFESLARRYWAAWGDVLRGAAPAAATIPGMGGPQLPPGVEAWQESLDLWTRLAHGGRTEANDAVGHFNTQARQWYARMQEVAARFAGQETNAVDVARAWKEALGAAGENPFPEMLRSLRGHGLQGLEQWVEDSSPWLQSVRDEGTSWLRMPAFGAGREQQERMQQLTGHMVEYQQASSAYAALMAKAQQEAFLIFENRLIDHEEPGRQLQSGRALFDLWIDAAEEAYADIALSPEFRDVYGQLVNAQMRVRGGVQRMVEDATAQLGMPTRSELDGAHRKLAQLEREVRRLRDALGRTPPPGAAEPVGAGTTAAPARRRGAAAPAPAKRGGSASRKAAKTAARAGTSGAAARRAAAAPAAAPKKAARRASSARSGFGGAISGSVPRAPEPIAKKGPAKAAKSAGKGPSRGPAAKAAKPVKKGKR